jgi:ParB family transcriptional regulator, chromosome partitioning protein
MAKPLRGLGRGFDALIPTQLDESLSAAVGVRDEVRLVEVESIKPNPHQPRKFFDEAELKSLADSIKQHGILQPLVVSDTGGGSFELIAGERRQRAARMAGEKVVPVIIRSFGDQEKLELALIENIQRADLNPIETAVAYRKLADQFNLTLDQISKRTGKAIPTVANTMRLLGLPASVQQLVIESKLAEGHARTLLSLEDPVQQEELAQLIIEKGLTARQVEAMVRQMKSGPSPDAKQAMERTSGDNEITKSLETYLQTKVRVTHTAKGGKLVIEYASDEDLQRIYRAITPVD